MTEATESKDTLNAFIGYMYALRDNDDRGALASLRRGMGQPPGAVIETARIVERQLAQGTPESVRAACYVVGPLFALHDDESGTGNLGNHFRKLCGEVKPNEELPKNVERRFKSLLESDRDELPDALRQAVTRLKAEAVPVNWFQLAQDVKDWQFEAGRERVRKSWSRSFWNEPRSSKPTQDADVDDASSAMHD
jgi:CRISPR system Cascade subunit CasB